MFRKARKQYKMASFKQPMLKCMKCQKQTNDPNVFTCDHWFCRNCTLMCYNECVKTMRERGQEPPPKSFPCHVCHKMTAVPPGGPCMLPAPDTATVEKITRDLQRVNISTGLQKSTDPVLSQPSTTPGVRQVTTCELLWEKNVSNGQDDIRIKSIDFLLDGAVCFIVAKVVENSSGFHTIQSSEIVCLSLEGKPATMPFPCSFTQPERISVRHEDRTVAIHCFEGKYTVYIYTKIQGWTCSSYTVDRIFQDMALGSGGQLVGIQRVNKKYRVIKFKSTGEQQWSVKIAPHSNAAPKVKVDKRDRVIISLVTEKRISIYSPDGDLLINIPQVFVKLPEGICTDSQGNIYIGDDSNNTIHQFSMEGQFLQTVVKSKIAPAYLAMYGNNYLAVSTYCPGIVGLYKINYSIITEVQICSLAIV